MKVTAITRNTIILGVLSPNGFCRPFDVDANGYMRSEAIAVVYLQKARNAKRIYATLVHSKTNCDGFKEQGITFPSTEMQSLLFQQFYGECNVSPCSVAYIEAHGTGTKLVIQKKSMQSRKFSARIDTVLF